MPGSSGVRVRMIAEYYPPDGGPVERLGEEVLDMHCTRREAITQLDRGAFVRMVLYSRSNCTECGCLSTNLKAVLKGQGFLCKSCWRELNRLYPQHSYEARHVSLLSKRQD